MSPDASALAALRREIDAIDDRLHDLLIERAAVVARVAAAKGAAAPGTQIVYPAREAQILRRLLDRHRGRLPAATVVRIWREIITASVRLQGALAVGFVADGDGPALRDLAREHFAAATPTMPIASAPELFAWVGDTPGALGVLPLAGADSDWWRHLVSAVEPRIQVVARLPLLRAAGGREALVIAPFAAGESGDDATLAVFESERDLSDDALARAAAAGGLTLARMAAAGAVEPMNAPVRLTLVEISGAASAIAPGLAGLATALRARRAHAVGGYARPLAPPDRR
jgi:chorismate mutase-like protein